MLKRERFRNRRDRFSVTGDGDGELVDLIYELLLIHFVVLYIVVHFFFFRKRGEYLE
jgi:hypothetical protein